MELSDEAAADLGAMLGIAGAYVLLSGLHTLGSKIVGGLFILLLKRVLLYTSISIYPAFWIQICFFCSMPDTQEWIRAAWTLYTRDEPPEGLPGREIANLVTKGLLLISYIIDVLIWNHLGTIWFGFWNHSLFLLCLGTALTALLPLPAVIFRWLGGKRWTEPHKHESNLQLGSMLLFTSATLIVVGLYRLFSAFLQSQTDLAMYVRLVLRPLPEKYQQRLPHKIYDYKSLDISSKEIRLIRLSRIPIIGITSSLEIFPLDAAPKYEAISYTWGSGVKDSVVFFDGYWLATTRNVYKILQDRASFFRVRWLWIDAVCINQFDNSEKSVQVGMMGDIYHRAQRVLVWFGDMAVKSSELTAAMFLLEKLNFNILNFDQFGSRINSLLLLAGTNESWDALIRLLSHPYWQRMWILQEIAKGQKVHILYGGRYISWEFLALMLQQLGVAPGNKMMVNELVAFEKDTMAMVNGVAQVNAIATVRDILLEGKLLTLEDSLIMTCKSLATDPRDKVFALGNLTPVTDGEENADIRPDYNLSIEEIYIRTAQNFLFNSSSNLLLQNGIGYPRKERNIPSWVPDWSTLQHQIREANNAPDQSRNHLQSYYASGDLVPGTGNSPFALSANILEVSLHGFSIGQVQRISAVQFAGAQGGLQAQKSFYEAAYSTAPSHNSSTYEATGQSLEEAFWRTLIGDRHPISNLQLGRLLRFQQPAQNEYGRYFQMWRDSIMGIERDPVSTGLGNSAIDSKDAGFAFGRALMNACGDGRRFAITENGMMSLVPPRTEERDHVFLIAGYGKPILLRPVDGVRWRLVGDAYVHGVMGGELWNGGKMAKEVAIC